MHGELPEYFNVAAHFLESPAVLHPERLAIVGEPREITYRELSALANRAGNALRSNGVSRGDRVLIVLPDSAEFVAAFFGAAKIGAVAVPVNPFARSADYIHYLENSEPRAARYSRGNECNRRIARRDSRAQPPPRFLPRQKKRPRTPPNRGAQSERDRRAKRHSSAARSRRDWRARKVRGRLLRAVRRRWRGVQGEVLQELPENGPPH